MALAVSQPDHPVLTPREIVELADKRTKQFMARDAAYDILNLYYFGSDLGNETVGILAANSQGRLLLRDLENYKGQGRVYSAQRLAPIVDDYQALIGRMPNSRVEPPDSSPQGESKAEMITKYLISTHELSDMDRQQADAGFHLSGLGDACYVLEVDSDLLRVVWSVVNPRCAYPGFYRGHRRFQLADLIVQTIEDPDVIKRDYEVTPKTNGPADCTVTIYLSPYQRTVVIGTSQGTRLDVGPHVEWDLGFCPAQWVYNKINGRHAQSDIAQSLAQQDFMDFADNILIDGLVRNVYGTLVGLKNPQNMGQDQIILGPNAPPIPLQDDGDIIVRQIGGDPAPALTLREQAISDINTAAGTSQVRQEGQMHSATQTGRAAHALQGPQGTRTDLKQQNVGSALRNANAMTIRMQVKAPRLGDHKFEIFGRFKGKSFSQQISGEDLQWEGSVWDRNTVTWDSMIGLNLQQKEQIATQGMLAELWDDIHARELVGVDDPIGMRPRIEAMKVARAQVEAKVQQIAGGQPQPGGPGHQQPPGGAPPAQPGGGPPMPQTIMRPPGLAQQAGPPGLPTGVPQGVSRQAISTALEPVADKLKGAVYAIGELALAGQSDRPQLVVEEWKDQPLVMQTVKPLAPSVKVVAAKGDLPEGSVRVA